MGSNERSETIVITSCLRPAATRFLSLADPVERLRHTVASLLCWFEEPSVRNVVICDNSGVDYDFGPLVRKAETLGVDFEALVFEDHGIAKRLGKGAGEGLILDHVMSHSRLLASSEAFWKCTGKYWVQNFPAVASAHRSDEAVFKRPGWSYRCPFEPARFGVARAGFLWARNRLSCLAKEVLYGFDADANVNTQFWRTSVAFFDRVLRDKYLLVNDRRRYFIEHVYARALTNEPVTAFRVAPKIVGKSGSIDATYGGGVPPEKLADAEALIARGLPGT